MEFLRERFKASAAYVRIAPFVIFLVLTFAQGLNDTSAPYIFYLVKTAVGAWLLWEMRAYVPEMKWAFSWEAVVVGVLVCVMWVGIDDFYPKFSKAVRSGIRSRTLARIPGSRGGQSLFTSLGPPS